MIRIKLTCLFFSFVFFLGCKTKLKKFEALDASTTGINFTNAIVENDEENVLTYEYFYNGGGLAAGDFNNDGLQDLFFTANQGENALYINKGNLEFEDYTKESGITWAGEWNTGVTVVDINQDGLLDIYLSCSGYVDKPEKRQNKLYINLGNSKFKEQAVEYNLNVDGYTTHTAFFDYDRDGDLDAYIMNHNVEDFKRFDVAAIHEKIDIYAGDQLLRNDNGKFVDVSVEAGIKRNPIGFGLGLHVADINDDGWPDLYISNDYIEADYLYINQKDGTFVDEINNRLDHNSYFSMGNDIADINNDLRPDIFTSDMLPEDNKRQKLLFGPEKYEGYLAMLRNGFLPEVMRNMLHLNNGDGTFSEVGQLAGVSNTDWSWSPLWADFNNDGMKDLFVTNGYLRDYTNNDFIKFYAEERREGRDNVLGIISKMPSTELSNYFFLQKGHLQFQDVTQDWGLVEKVISNGAVYVDLDNDGDLDIVTNNINKPASVYRNTAPSGNYLKVNLIGKYASNAKVKLFCGDLLQYRESTTIHGFQSSLSGPLHFGLGAAKTIDSLIVEWNNGQYQLLKGGDLGINKTIQLEYKPSGGKPYNQARQPFFRPQDFQVAHGQIEINDFSRQILLPYMYSYQGPAIAVGDIDNDGREEVYVGGGKASSGRIFYLNANNKWLERTSSTFRQDELSTDSDAVFNDIDGDGDLDLIVISSGFEYLKNDLALQNRVYLNDGQGKFSKSTDTFPPDFYADSKCTLIDYDRDGDEDLFVAGYVIPQAFPYANPSRLYENRDGKYIRVQNNNFQDLGIVTDVVSHDFDQDGDEDLIIAQEWGELLAYINNDGEFNTDETICEAGLWQSLSLVDVNNDGAKELLAGNFGLNSQLNATVNEPLRLHVGDYDENGRDDVILSMFLDGVSHPYLSRDELGDQLPKVKKIYPTYESYAAATTESLLKSLGGQTQRVLSVEKLSSQLIEYKNGVWEKLPMPIEMQAAPLYGAVALDIDHDGDKDLIVGGNNYRTRVRLGNLDANHGQLYLNSGAGKYEYVNNYESGLNFLGDVRSLTYVHNTLWVGVNSGYLQQYTPLKTVK